MNISVSKRKKMKIIGLEVKQENAFNLKKVSITIINSPIEPTYLVGQVPTILY